MAQIYGKKTMDQCMDATNTRRIEGEFIHAIIQFVMDAIAIPMAQRNIFRPLLYKALEEKINSNKKDDPGLLQQFLMHELDILADTFRRDFDLPETIKVNHSNATHAMFNDFSSAIKNKPAGGEVPLFAIQVNDHTIDLGEEDKCFDINLEMDYILRHSEQVMSESFRKQIFLPTDAKLYITYPLSTNGLIIEDAPRSESLGSLIWQIANIYKRVFKQAGVSNPHVMIKNLNVMSSGYIIINFKK